jgi:TIR domain
VSNDEVLAKAHALYDFLRSMMGGKAVAEGDYRKLRAELLQAVGLDALPDVVRDGRTLDDCKYNLGNADGDWKTLQQSFRPLFDRLERHELPATPPLPAPAGGDAPDIFISHSSADRQLAERLVDLFAFAMQLGPERIRCTSVEGSGVQGGDRFEERLRAEIAGARVFVALITPNLLHSHYALFEIGALGAQDQAGHRPRHRAGRRTGAAGAASRARPAQTRRRRRAAGGSGRGARL